LIQYQDDFARVDPPSHVAGSNGRASAKMKNKRRPCAAKGAASRSGARAVAGVSWPPGENASPPRRCASAAGGSANESRAGPRPAADRSKTLD
jgi:hypothetical protein